MVQPLVIQGSWEEISARAEEFKDRNDLLLIVPAASETQNGIVKEGISLAEALKGRTGLVSFEPSDLSKNTGKKFASLLTEKHSGRS